jgi:hypothetical protein
MADKDFKVKSGLTMGTPLPPSMGGTGQTSLENAFNAILPLQSGNAGKVLTTDGSGVTSWITLPAGFTRGDTASRPGSPSLGDIYSNTQTGYIEVYTAAGWSQLGVIPVVPTIGTATDVGTNIAYGSGSASITFTPATTGGLASSFTATSTSGGYSATGSSSPIVVPNIPTGTSATFTVTATNGYGNSLATTASNSITTTSVPQAPTVGTASNPANSPYASTGPASITFTANATGNKSIANYKWSTDGTNYTALSPSQTTSPLSVPGLTSGSSYTLRLRAVNANGDSLASSESNSVTISTVPQAPSISSVASNTVNVGRVSVNFSAGATGNSTITSYSLIPNSGSPASVTSSPGVVTGLTPGATYTFTAKATNANGTSLASSSSSSVVASYAICSSGGATYNGTQCQYNATQYTGYNCPSGYSMPQYYQFRGCTFGDVYNYSFYNYNGATHACAGGSPLPRCCYAQTNNPGGSAFPECTSYTYYGCPSGGSVSGSTCLYSAQIV